MKSLHSAMASTLTFCKYDPLPGRFRGQTPAVAERDG